MPNDCTLTLPPKYVACIMLGLLTASLNASICAHAEIWEESVQSSNQAAIVSIKVEAVRHNDLVDSFEGTGFIVHRDGQLITCSHVVPEAGDLYKEVKVTGTVGSRQGLSLTLDFIARDERWDLALLKLPEQVSGWQPVRGNGQGKRGTPIVALGFPRNLNIVPARGIITSTHVKGGRWLTDAEINPGMSGSPVFNDAGTVVAIAVAGYKEGEALNILMPISFAQNLLESIGAWPLGQSTQEPVELLTKRAVAFLLGYDSAFALAHARMGRDITQDLSRINEYVRRMSLPEVQFPQDPLGTARDAEPVGRFAREVVGVLEARDARLRNSFLVGFLGVIATNTPSLKPEEFDLRSTAVAAGFPPRPEFEDAEYLEYLAQKARKYATGADTSGATVVARKDPLAQKAPQPCRHPSHGIESWGQENEFRADSGWRGGGSSPGEYCGGQLLQRQQQYPQRQIYLVDSGEEHKSEYTPFKHDYYRYWCTFREVWDPVYKLAASEHCM